MRARAISLALLALVACERTPEREPEPETETETETEIEPATETEAELAGVASCVGEPPETWLEDVTDARTIAIAIDDRGGRVAVSDGERARVRALDARGAAIGDARDTAIRGDLLALEPIGEAFVIVTRGACAPADAPLAPRDPDAVGAHCLIAATEGGAPTAAPLPGPLVTSRRASTDGRLYLAWSAPGGHRGLELYVIDDGRLGRVRIPLGPEPASRELPVEILGLAAHGERWAVLARRGAAEDARSEVTLTTSESHRAIEALHEALVVEAMRVSARTVELVVGFEMSRPHLLSLSPRADEPLSARALAHGESPEGFADRETGVLDLDARGLTLRRRSAAGDPLGAPTRVTEGTVRAAAVARRGRDYLVAWLDDAVRARWLRCPPRAE